MPTSDKRRAQLRAASKSYYESHKDEVRAKRRAKYAEMKAALEELNAQREHAKQEAQK